MIRQSYSSLKKLETNSEQHLTVKESNILNWKRITLLILLMMQSNFGKL